MIENNIIINDNLGVIIDPFYLEISKDRDKILKGSRKVEDTIENHDKEERRLSIKIAKANLARDPNNKYYKSVMDKLIGYV